MYSNLYLAMFDSLKSLFEGLSELIKLSEASTIALIAFAAILLATFMSTKFAIEITTNKAVNKINKYLEKKPFVNEENLVEFNNLMKSIPKPMRYQWQQYMLNRESVPSKFMTQNNCIERPFKSSSYEQTIFVC